MSRRALRSTTPLLLPLALIAASACVSRGLRADETILHHRALLGADAEGRLAVAELRAADGEPPRLRLLVLADEPATIATAPTEAAAAAAEAVRRGAPLQGALPAELRAAARGFDRPIAMGPPPLSPAGPLSAWRIVRRDDAIALAGPPGHAVLHRLAGDPRVELGLAAPSVAVALVSMGDGAFSVRDVARLDLADGVARAHAAAAEAALPGDPAAALALAREGRGFGDAGGALPFLEARALARLGRPLPEVLPPLAAATAANASLYRMYARTAPELRRYRGEPDFDELVRPRPLPGTNRAGD